MQSERWSPQFRDTKNANAILRSMDNVGVERIFLFERCSTATTRVHHYNDRSLESKLLHLDRFKSNINMLSKPAVAASIPIVRVTNSNTRVTWLTVAVMLLTLLLTGWPLAKHSFGQDRFASQIEPLSHSVDLDVGTSTDVTLRNGSKVHVKVLAMRETLDEVCFAVRRADVSVEINGQPLELVSANYNLPKKVGPVQIDCPITKGNNANGDVKFWGLDKDVRLRIWPVESALINPRTFMYPVKQKWFANKTQMANEPVYVDGGERPGKRPIYYHSGLDIGGSEGLVEVIAATDGLVVSAADQTLAEHRKDTPVSPRYDVVYVLDARGWYYRYSHLKEIDKNVLPGRVLKMGDRIGLLGKEGGSGGWSHLHFEIKSRQPSGKWGTEEGYAFLWEANIRENQPATIAVARPHHLLWSGNSITLDGSKSWSNTGANLQYHWQFTDGSQSTEPIVTRRYDAPGKYSEILRVVDGTGKISYDFANVYVYDSAHRDRLLPSIHANYYPTSNIKPRDEVTFKVRSFGNTNGKELWDFGDGSPTVQVQSDGNKVALALDGYATTKHRYQSPGDYIVRVERTDPFGVKAVAHLHVHVETPNVVGETSQHDPTKAWDFISPFFAPPEKFQGQLAGYRSVMQFDDGRFVTRAEQWPARRAEIMQYWEEKLGKWPALITAPKLEILETVRRENFQQSKVRFEWMPGELTTGYLLVPDGDGPKPGVITVYYEPETAIGLNAPQRDFALQLARRGFVTLSIGTTDATKNKTYSLYYPNIEDAKVEPLSMLGYAAANAWYALATRSEVDSTRIGIVGHSFGGKWAMFGSCLFDKFACAAWSDPGIVFDDQRGNINYWEPWYLGYHPKPWRTRGLVTSDNPAKGAYPILRSSGRDLHELHALMAPRPFLVSGGAEDPIERWVPLNHTIAVNSLLGQNNRVAMTNRPEHAPNEESNAQIYAFFEHFLLSPTGTK